MWLGEYRGTTQAWDWGVHVGAALGLHSMGCGILTASLPDCSCCFSLWTVQPKRWTTRPESFAELAWCLSWELGSSPFMCQGKAQGDIWLWPAAISSPCSYAEFTVQWICFLGFGSSFWFVGQFLGSSRIKIFYCIPNPPKPIQPWKNRFLGLQDPCILRRLQCWREETNLISHPPYSCSPVLLSGKARKKILFLLPTHWSFLDSHESHNPRN